MPKKIKDTNNMTRKNFDRVMEALPKQLVPSDVAKLMAGIIYSYNMVGETPAILTYTLILLRDAGVTMDKETGELKQEKVQMH